VPPCAPVSAPVSTPSTVAQSVNQYDPLRPHAKNFRCGGIWMCNCGETDCPYMESGFSPKKDSPCLVIRNPDLRMNGSSSTDCGTKVSYVSTRGSNRKDVCVAGVANRQRTKPVVASCGVPTISNAQFPSTTPSVETSHDAARESKEPPRSSMKNPPGGPGKQPKLKR
jgi:hypothetical protein